ncbi:bifunctional folylpolyglutamate synthase/dihydrofolate synthase ['Catharanthus roseus' aster yellows phytoplasma]|uniref:tetrahydrofolate synthase n=1 Tax='Catharanthus roseus' aster yellows phytoplasma TaxID=1193712 RepID=A0A4P6M8D2_9MOLU|nr:folylpolyglutamate synthase/dihydrofolate synthase family protein ['Catharanthus roseus' aster yellows phytoplasma]QBF23629.1 bifunctional folylpolyglutamate synthase/dihydrofolate synthase ['Catharanthus roseus' aster yellows phytoplasma]
MITEINNIKEAILWIEKREILGMRLGLLRVLALLKLLHHPEKKLAMIHIAGTNGKGSTVNYLSSLLQQSCSKVGTFISPHIQNYNERIKINGETISCNDLIIWVRKIKKLVDQASPNSALFSITPFEIITAIAFDYFYHKKVDVCVIEVGLGGLLDSTNVIYPILTGITTIGKDHEHILGKTLKEIAFQKAGIIKPKIPLVTGNISQKALLVIEQQAIKNKTPIYKFKKDYNITYLGMQTWQECFNFKTKQITIKAIKTPLIGKYQPENAAMAIKLYYLFCQLKKFPFLEQNVFTGISKTQIPARMQKLNSTPLIILDGAHNVHAIRKLVQTTIKQFSNYRISILFSALENKNVVSMLYQLLKIPKSHIYLTTFNHPNSIELVQKYLFIAPQRITKVFDWQDKLKDFLQQNQTQNCKDLLLIIGSLYFASEVIHFFDI